MGVEAPDCVNTKNEAKCIALFYGQFISVVGALGDEWNVIVEKNEEYWLVYQTKANSFVKLDTLLYRININSGKPSEFLPKN